MRVVIIGAGAIGSYLGAALAQAGHRVGLLGRPAYVERVRTHGIAILRGGVERVTADVAVDDRLEPLIDSLGGVETALVTAKAFDTAEDCRLLQPWLGGGLERVVLVQNGVGGDEIAAGILPADTLVTGVVTQVVAVRDVARYEVLGRKGGLCLAPWLPDGPPVAPLVELFVGAGLPCSAYSDARSMRWSKLLLNMLANAVPAIVDLPVAEVYADDTLYALEIAAYREALAVMHAAEVRPSALPGYPVPLLARLLGQGPNVLVRAFLRRTVGGARGGKKPSLQGDLERGRRDSEVLFLNGAVAREGARLGVPTPVNETIAAVLVGLAEGSLARDAFRRAPAALAERARARGWRGGRPERG